MEPLIRSIADACAFIKEWSGAGDALAGRPTDMSLPAALQSVNDSFGRLWEAGAVDDDHPLRWLFTAQDEIFLPSSAAEDGVQLVVKENQGLWQFGFRPGQPDHILIRGDLEDDPDPHPPSTDRVSLSLGRLMECDHNPDDPAACQANLARLKAEIGTFIDKVERVAAEYENRGWRPTKISLEKMLIFALLQNLVLSQERTVYQDTRPDDAVWPLFAYSAFGGQGFLTNQDRTLLAYEAGDFFVVRKETDA